MSNGYIKLYRDIQEHWIWQDDEPFTRRTAWIDMLMRANHKPNKLRLDNAIVRIERGQFLCSERNIASDWQWSRTKLRKFWQLLISDEMIEINTDQKKTIVTICNYSTWQGDENQEKTKEKPQGSQRGAKVEPKGSRNKNVKNVKNEKKSSGNSVPPTESEVLAYFQEQDYIQPLSEARKFWRFYESKNWYVGKNKMKNWHMAAGNWNQRNKEDRAKQRDAQTTGYHGIRSGAYDDL